MRSNTTQKILENEYVSFIFLGFFLFLLPGLGFVANNFLDPSLYSLSIFELSVELALLSLSFSVLLFLLIRIFFNINLGRIFIAMGLLINLWPYIHIMMVQCCDLVPLPIRPFTAFFSAWLIGCFILSLNVVIRVLWVWVLILYFIFMVNILHKSYELRATQEIVHKKIIPIVSDVHYSEKRNIYYVILDNHGAPGLLKNFGYSNQSFIEKMTGMGFFHAEKSVSSYNATYLTLRSIFDVDYFIDENSEKYKHRGYMFPEMMYQELKNPPYLISLLRKLGYELFWVGNEWGTCTGSTINCLGASLKGIYCIKIFLESNPIFKAYWKLRTQFIKSKETQAQGGLSDAIDYFKKEGVPRKPSFVFIHDLTPHPPFAYKASCEKRNLKSYSYTDNDKNLIPYYIESAYCANTRALDFAEYLAKADPNAVVIIQGDHGSNFIHDFNARLLDLTQEQFNERSSILNLLKLPKICQPLLTNNIGTINSVRLAVACALGQKPVLVADKTYFGVYEANPDFGKVVLAKG